ncbi:MAG: aldehyde dehydrogenase family protein [Saprospiraceae bacterium]|nr:aldehyde dehydrogenase family protein [Saprospiraceae bacterium]
MITDFTIEQLKEAYQTKRNFFDSGSTLEYSFRLQSLQKLKTQIKYRNDEIQHALKMDLSKPVFEAYTAEIGVLIDEIDYAMKNLKYWMRPKSISTPLPLQPSSSKIYPEPKGVVMIFSPWNYPFQLLLMPLVGAVAAGNTVILKPAHETSHTALLLEKIVKASFNPEHVSVVQGNGKNIGELLLDNFRFDHIFFTGSQGVGKWVMSKAAEHLTPVTLELGGKSPTIVDKNVNLKAAVSRITWAKYYNAGQTCICPDYILVHKDIKDKLISQVKLKITEYFGTQPEDSPDFARIINNDRFEVLTALLKQGKILHGGETNPDKKYIAPTIIEIDNLDEEIMQKEIFGPIMPILTWENKEELLTIIRRNRYPLSCYIYSNDKKLSDFIIKRVEFGGGCVNNSAIHFVNNELPFGGIQNSGVGRYHGKYSFETFSHMKGMVHSPTWFNPDFLFAPYTNFKLKLAKLFLG